MESFYSSTDTHRFLILVKYRSYNLKEHDTIHIYNCARLKRILFNNVLWHLSLQSYVDRGGLSCMEATFQHKIYLRHQISSVTSKSVEINNLSKEINIPYHILAKLWLTSNCLNIWLCRFYHQGWPAFCNWIKLIFWFACIF